MHIAIVVCTTVVCALASAAAGMSGAGAQDILTSRAANREQMIIDGARKEGRVVLYSAAIVNQAQRPLAQAFMKKYPFVKMTFWRGDTEEIIAKLSAETRAKNLVADLVEGTGVGELAVEAKLALPYLLAHGRGHAGTLPRSARHTGRAHGSAITASPTTPAWCRPIRCRRATTTCSTRAGAASSPGASGPRPARRCSSPPSGWRAARRRRANISASSPRRRSINFGSGSARTLVDRVIAGEFPIALNIFAHHPLISRAKGAPVNSQLMDPVPSTAGTMIIPRGVRNPHAALLLADFILSQEGQEILAAAEYFPVRSDVPPKESWPRSSRSAPACRSCSSSSDQLNHYTESSQKIFDEMFR